LLYCDDTIAKLKSFWGFEPELQTNPMLFHLGSLQGATLTALRACAMDWRRKRIILTVRKNWGPILSRFGPKLMKFWDDVGDRN